MLDLILSDIDRAQNKVSIIRTKADVPSKPNSGKVTHRGCFEWE